MSKHLWLVVMGNPNRKPMGNREDTVSTFVLAETEAEARKMGRDWRPAPWKVRRVEDRGEPRRPDDVRFIEDPEYGLHQLEAAPWPTSPGSKIIVSLHEGYQPSWGWPMWSATTEEAELMAIALQALVAEVRRRGA